MNIKTEGIQLVDFMSSIQMKRWPTCCKNYKQVGFYKRQSKVRSMSRKGNLLVQVAESFFFSHLILKTE
jgi:hypothetical protein